MPNGLTLSQKVQTYIDTLDFEYDLGLSPEERQEAAKAQKVAEVIVSDVIRSREILADDKLEGTDSLVHSHPGLIAYFLDDHYTRETIDAVSGYVRRTTELSRMDASRTIRTGSASGAGRMGAI